MSGNVCMKGE